MGAGEFHHRKQTRLSGSRSGWVTEKRAFFGQGGRRTDQQRSEGSKAVIKLPLYERDVNGPLPYRPPPLAGFRAYLRG